MKSAAPRWAVSFADLGLLLLGCFVMVHAIMAIRPEAEIAAAPAAAPRAAVLRSSEIFETGEARLRPGGRTRLGEIARGLPAGAVEVVSRGTAEGGSRLDRFELAAARAAAVARALRESGVGESRLSLRLEAASGAVGGQEIEITGR